MKKYLAFFRLRFSVGLQYRAAALAGVITQLAWGSMEILTFRAFYQADPNAFPMDFQALCAYIWLQQAFLSLFMAWMMEWNIFQAIIDGNIAYELCRPTSLYGMWFARTLALRISRVILRCIPLFLVASLLPKPWGLRFAASGATFGVFLISLLLATCVGVAFCLIVYFSCFVRSFIAKNLFLV